MNVDAYLHRLGYQGSRAPTAATLSALHEAHLLAVPFENLDIGLGRVIRLDLEALFEKIVTQRRGGFCYELNGLFAALLTALGYRVTLLSARVSANGVLGPAFDHLALLVEADGAWLADVGFGDCFIRPLPLAVGEYTQADRRRIYRLSRTMEDHWLVEERWGDGAWEADYQFSLQPYRLEDFAALCRWQQTAPASHFTQQRVCSLPTAAGRVTVRGQRLIVTSGTERLEHELADEGALAAALADHFGIHTAGGTFPVIHTQEAP